MGNSQTQVDDNERAREQAEIQLESVIEMVRALEAAEKTDNDDTREEALQAISEDPLEVSIRSGWYAPGTGHEAHHYKILLCTGGPAVRIIGELTEHDEPGNAQLEYQDWFTPWIEYPLNDEQQNFLVKYASCFYFVDG